MPRLLLASIALAAAFAVAAGSRTAPARARSAPAPLLEQPAFCASEPDGGTRPAPHGLLMVADRSSALPCAQGG